MLKHVCLVCKHAPKFRCSVSQFCLQLLDLVEDVQFLSFNMPTRTVWSIGGLFRLLSLFCVYFNRIILTHLIFLLVYLKNKIL